MTGMTTQILPYKTVIACRRVVLENQPQRVWENRVGFGKLSPSQNAHLLAVPYVPTVLPKETGFRAVLRSRDSDVISTKG